MANQHTIHPSPHWQPATKTRWAWWQQQWHQPIAVPLLLLLTLALGALAWALNIGQDLTHNQRNSLSIASQQVLHTLSGEIRVQAYCSNSPYKGRYFRKSISSLMQRYQRHYPTLTLSFIDPVSESALARKQHIKKEGELIVYYKGQQARMYLPYSEEAFTNLLLGLKHGHASPLLFIEGQQAPSLVDNSPHGASQLKLALQEAGIPTLRAQAIAPLRTSPDHTLVLAGANQPYPPAFVTSVQSHLKAGGNLVWLTDQPRLTGMQAVADQLGIVISDGIAIDPANLTYDIALHELSSQHYASQGATEDFALRTFFSQAHSVMATGASQPYWKVTPLIALADQGWVSLHYQPGQHKRPVFDAANDQAGPVTVALSLQHMREDGSSQRVIIVGSSRSLQNAALSRGGNLAMAVKLLQWVRHNQPSISLTPTPLRDSIVLLPQDGQKHLLLLGMFNGFQFGLPVLLLFAAWMAWRRRSV